MYKLFTTSLIHGARFMQWRTYTSLTTVMRTSVYVPDTCLLTPLNSLLEEQRLKSHQSKATKKGKKKGTVGGKTDILDVIDDDDDDDDDPGNDIDDADTMRDTPLSRFLKTGLKASGKGSSIVTIKYAVLMKVVDGEALWRTLQQEVDSLKEFYVQQLSVRSSTSLDQLQVELEGDMFPLNEIAAISKKDPKRLVIDASAFPQAAANIMTSIREAGVNLNPQQDGLKIFVPIPKVTKEYRESLVVGAKKRLNVCKDDLRSVQNKFTKKVNEATPPSGVSKDDIRTVITVIKLITDNFMATADQLLVTKTKELMGK